MGSASFKKANNVMGDLARPHMSAMATRLGLQLWCSVVVFRSSFSHYNYIENREGIIQCHQNKIVIPCSRTRAKDLWLPIQSKAKNMLGTPTYVIHFRASFV